MRLNIDLTQGKTPINVFFTSDFHLFHNNALKFDKRPFIDVHQMHNEIENRWNSVVTDNDIVIFLGDLSFAKSGERDYVNSIIYKLNGKIHFVLGNHDKRDEILKMDRFETVNDYLELTLKHMEINEKTNIIIKKVESLFCCMHYPIHSWNKKHYGSFMAHGHTHMSLSELDFHQKNRIIDVCCTGNYYTPISYIEIINKLARIPLDNLNRDNN